MPVYSEDAAGNVSVQNDPSQSNNVWNTLSNVASQLIDYKRAVALAKLDNTRNVTASSPSGRTDSTTVNPFPGTQGAYPQAEAKPKPGSPDVAFLSSPILLIIAFVLALILVMRR